MCKFLKVLIISGAFLPLSVWGRGSDIWSELGRVRLVDVDAPQLIFPQILKSDDAPQWAWDIRRFFDDHGAMTAPGTAKFSQMAGSTTLFTEPLERFSEIKFWRVVLQQLRASDFENLSKHYGQWENRPERIDAEIVHRFSDFTNPENRELVIRAFKFASVIGEQKIWNVYHQILKMRPRKETIGLQYDVISQLKGRDIPGYLTEDIAKLRGSVAVISRAGFRKHGDSNGKNFTLDAMTKKIDRLILKGCPSLVSELI